MLARQICIALILFLPSFATASEASISEATVDSITTRELSPCALENGKIKDFTLLNSLGKPVRLYEALEKSPVVLTFYRGGWCPICSLQLQEYQSKIGLIRAVGGQVIALSPELPEVEKTTINANALQFEVLSDIGNNVARMYGILWHYPEEDASAFKGFLKEKYGKEYKDYTGTENVEMPIPATFVIAQDGTIAYSFIDEDYKLRAPIDEIIKALEKLKAEKEDK